MTGEVDTCVSAGLYQANGIFRNDNDDVIATLTGNLNASDMILTGLPIITYTNIKYDSQVSALTEQLSSITVQLASSKLFDEQLKSNYTSPWRLNSDETNVNIGYEALIDNASGILSSCVNELMNKRKNSKFYWCFTF